MGGFLRDVMRHQRRAAELPHRRAGRDRVQPACRRSSRSPGATGTPPRRRTTTSTSAPTVASWKSSASTPARAGWKGYLLTGRHGLFSCYEAFIHIVDSMVNQHAKWLKTSREIGWRSPIASLNYLLTSHVWRQDHNGSSHQDPGFMDLVANKKADTVRIYLPPDANTLLWVTDHCLRSWDRINVIVAGKQPEPQWLDMDAAIKHCERGLGLWAWASNDRGGEPDVVMACAGDVPTLECLAAVDFMRTHVPEPQGPRGQRRRPDDAGAGPAASARTGGCRVRCAVHTRQAGDLRLPRLSGADPPAGLPTATTTRTSTCTASRRRERRPRPSTWWCSTVSTASTS